MVFVTAGSQKFPFDRLLCTVDQCVRNGIIVDSVFAIILSSHYKPIHMHIQYESYLNKELFAAKLYACDTVITHGGIVMAVHALKQYKRVIATPRFRAYGEHIDNHHVQLLKELGKTCFILTCGDVENLTQAYKRSFPIVYPQFYSNSERFVNDLSEYLLSTDVG